MSFGDTERVTTSLDALGCECGRERHYCPTCRCPREEHGCTLLLCGVHGLHRDIAAERGPGQNCPVCHCGYAEHGCTNLICRTGTHRKRQP